jgi:acetyltransferase EpsM
MSARRKLLILGARSFAEEVADVVSESDEYELVGFAENQDRERCRESLLGLPILWVDDLPPLASSHHVVCALATTKRSRFLGQAEAMGFQFATVRHPTAHVSRTARVGDGSILGARVVVAAHAVIGRHVILNRGCLIGHHTVVDDGVTLSPGANVAGGAHIGPRTYVGMGAIVLDHITVGKSAVIGAGAIVTKDVPDHVQVMGPPARVLRTDIDGR